MKTLTRVLALVVALALPSIAISQTSIDTILADSSRPEADRERDATTRPDLILEFFDIGPGDQVADLLSGGGYFTRILVPLTGANGRVYSGNNPFFDGFFGEALTALLSEDGFEDVVRIDAPVDSLSLPINGSLDAAIMVQAYHDLLLGEEDRGLMNRSVFMALKSGGVYGIVDHAAAPGSGTSATESLHRIDQQFIIDEVEAAGFDFVSEADYLANPDDDHSAMIFDPSMRGQTDRFILRFEKP